MSPLASKWRQQQVSSLAFALLNSTPASVLRERADGRLALQRLPRRPSILRPVAPWDPRLPPPRFPGISGRVRR